MNPQAQNLLTEALKLPAGTREELAVRLMSGVEPNAAEAESIKQAWGEEIDRRVARFESGESSAIPISEAWPKLTGSPWRGGSTDE